MDITFGKLMYYHTKARLTSENKPVLRELMESTKENAQNFWDFITLKNQKKLQYELIKYQSQLNMIERNLNTSNISTTLDIIR